MSSLFARALAVVPLIATSSLAGKEGYFYKLDASNQAVIVSAITDVPHGVIGSVSEDGLEISALPLGGNHGTVRVKLGTAVTDLRKALTVKADGTAESDDGSGARVFVAIPLETGAADEMIECVLIAPRALPAGVGLTTFVFPIQLDSMTTAAADLLTNFTPGFAFEIIGFSFAVTKLGTGSGASQVLNLEIGTTNLTGGVLTLLLADATPLGKVTAATAITAANTGSATDTISVEVAASGTVFTAGAGNLLITVRNLDTVNALAGRTA